MWAVYFLATIGALVIVMAIVGATDVADFHAYFGPDASQWHADLAKRKKDD